ncbi:MAG: hypothetical protein RML12_07395 [Xanthomonadales bacterium]|nr:hypothetical protein [Xanthomonadales bacterium]
MPVRARPAARPRAAGAGRSRPCLPPDPQGLLVDYEVVAPLVAHLGPVLRLRIDEAGCAEIHRPAIFRHPGTHRQALSAGEVAALAAELAALPRDLDQAARKLAREPAPAEGFAVADAPLRAVPPASDGEPRRSRSPGRDWSRTP